MYLIKGTQKHNRTIPTVLIQSQLVTRRDQYNIGPKSKLESSYLPLKNLLWKQVVGGRSIIIQGE